MRSLSRRDRPGRAQQRAAVRQHRSGDPGQARRHPQRAGLPAGRGAPAARGRARAPARPRWPGRWRRRSAVTWNRIQFTPDLLPSDVTGVSVFNQATATFEFRPGPIFANIVLADEINRASPKTQSALLEVMEEGTVSADALGLPDAAAVHGGRDPEPDRHGGHLPPARGAARPVPDEADGRLPDAGGRGAVLRTQKMGATVDPLAPVLTARRRAAR